MAIALEKLYPASAASIAQLRSMNIPDDEIHDVIQEGIRESRRTTGRTSEEVVGGLQAPSQIRPSIGERAKKSVVREATFGLVQGEELPEPVGLGEASADLVGTLLGLLVPAKAAQSLTAKGLTKLAPALMAAPGIVPAAARGAAEGLVFTGLTETGRSVGRGELPDPAELAQTTALNMALFGLFGGLFPKAPAVLKSADDVALAERRQRLGVPEEGAGPAAGGESPFPGRMEAGQATPAPDAAAPTGGLAGPLDELMMGARGAEFDIPGVTSPAGFAESMVPGLPATGPLPMRAAAPAAPELLQVGRPAPRFRGEIPEEAMLAQPRAEGVPRDLQLLEGARGAEFSLERAGMLPEDIQTIVTEHPPLSVNRAIREADADTGPAIRSKNKKGRKKAPDNLPAIAEDVKNLTVEQELQNVIDRNNTRLDDPYRWSAEMDIERRVSDSVKQSQAKTRKKDLETEHPGGKVRRKCR